MAAPRIGYLLPTRERVMTGQHETAPLLALAERAERWASIRSGSAISVTARPRHDPMTLMAAVAARTTPRRDRHRGAAARAAQPGAAGPSVGDLGPDQRGPGDPRRRHRFRRPEHPRRVRGLRACPWDKRLGRMMEGLRLCRALWSGEPVTWEGRWTAEGPDRRPDAAPPRRPADLGRGQRGGDDRAGGQASRRLVPERARSEAVCRDLDGDAGGGAGGGARSGGDHRRGLPDARDRRGRGARRGPA